MQAYIHIRAIIIVVILPYMYEKFGEWSTYREYRAVNRYQPIAEKKAPGISL